MKTKTFAAFVAPSVVMMMLFIAFPLVGTLFQSFFVSRSVVETVEVKNCAPGFLKPICTAQMRTLPKFDENGRPMTETVFVGLQSYRNILEPAEAWQALTSGDWAGLMNIDFWKALRFTLTFTFVTLPLVLLIGLAIALSVNSIGRRVRGPVIFVSLLPFVITPVIGALSIRWLFIGDGILTNLLQWLLDTPVTVFSQAWSTELLLIVYRVWHIAPFAFVVFYAGLQTVNQDTLESALIDGATRWERLRYVILPHLQPLIVFVALIHMMDSYRVFEEIVGLNTQSYVISLQWITYEYLLPDNAGTRQLSRAAANSMLTMIGIVILLIPLLRQVWRAHRSVRL